MPISQLRVCGCVWLQLTNDIEKAKADIAAAEKRLQELQQLVAQAKQGKEDTVRGSRKQPWGWTHITQSAASPRPSFVLCRAACSALMRI